MPPESCAPCTSRQSNPAAGLYNPTCLQCCSTLILSAHPLKTPAAALLAALLRHPANPGRAQVLASVRLALEKHPSASKK